EVLGVGRVGGEHVLEGLVRRCGATDLDHAEIQLPYSVSLGRAHENGFVRTAHGDVFMAPVTWPPRQRQSLCVTQVSPGVSPKSVCPEPTVVIARGRASPDPSRRVLTSGRRTGLPSAREARAGARPIQPNNSVSSPLR